MNLKRYTSHLTISSEENNAENKKSKINLIKAEKYIQRLILISIKTKKFLEDNDYFYKRDKRRKFNVKKIKLKPTPFQKYQIFKNTKYLATEKRNTINNNKRILTSYPINKRQRMNKINTNLITINNFNKKQMKKNKTHNNNQFQFYHTYNNFFSKPKRHLTNTTELTEPNDYYYNNSKFYNQKLKTRYNTISIKKTNRKIQTTEIKKENGYKIYSELDKFPILNIFDSHSNKINLNLFRYKSGKAKEERKNRKLLNNFDKIKFNNILIE